MHFFSKACKSTFGIIVIIKLILQFIEIIQAVFFKYNMNEQHYLLMIISISLIAFCIFGLVITDILAKKWIFRQ